MSDDPGFSDRVRALFVPNPGGVVGLVDDLLELSLGGGLRLDFRDGQCHVRPSEPSSSDPVDIPLQKSVFRGILARVAALCNEHVPDSVSPYRGEGELSAGTVPPAIFRVAFTNTPDEQRLEINCVGNIEGEAERYAASVA